MQSEILVREIITAITCSVLPILAGQNIGAILANKLSLQRLSKYNGKVIVDKDFVLNKINSIPKEEVDFTKKEFLLPLVEELRYYVSEEDLKVVYNNITSVKVKKNFLPMILGAVGSYDTKRNKISYAQNSALGHEFLHMASATYDKENDLNLAGFRQRKGMASIGMGINEGYTELLASRLYNKKNKVEAYKTQVKIAEMLEFFFDDPKEMAHLYFGCNLPGLIKHLEQYASREEVIKLIMDIDSIGIYSQALGNPIPTVKSIQTQVTLYNWFVSKNNNPEKLERFKDLVSENKMASMIINKQKMKLYRESPYITQEQSVLSEERRPRL